MKKNGYPQHHQGFWDKLKQNKKEIGKGVVAAVALGAAAVGALTWNNKANKENHERYLKEQAAIEHVIDPTMDRIGGEALKLATEHPEDFDITPVKEGVKVSADETGKYDNRAGLSIVIGLDANGKPDPSKTLFVGIRTSGSVDKGPGYVKQAALTAPGGEGYARQGYRFSDVEGWTATCTSLKSLDGQVQLGLGGTVDSADSSDYLKSDPTAVGTAQYSANYTSELFKSATDQIIH